MEVPHGLVELVLGRQFPLIRPTAQHGLAEAAAAVGGVHRVHIGRQVAGAAVVMLAEIIMVR